MRIFTNNWRLKLAAVFIASSTWGVVAYAGNPVITREFPRVQVQPGPLPNNNWVVVNQLPPVSVTTSGLQQGLSAYDQKNLRAVVDLSHARIGLNTLRVQVDSGDPAVTVSRVVPDTLSVTVDEKDIVTKKVELRLKSSPNICCVAQNTNAAGSPDSVRLSGPKSILAKAKPYVDVDLTEARTSIKVDQATVKLDGTGSSTAPLVTIEPAAISVTVPITVVHKAIQAFVVVKQTGQPAPGYELGAVTVAPSIVTLEGDPNIVGPITSVDTDPINIGGATGDIVRSVSLRPPAGVTVVGSSTVSVRITVTQSAAPTPSPSASPSPSPSPTR